MKKLGKLIKYFLFFLVFVPGSITVPLVIVAATLFLTGGIDFCPPKDVQSASAINQRYNLIDVRGQIHVHCYRSHDSKGTWEEIARAAQSAGLGWIILTDHPSPTWEAPELNQPRNQNGVLIIFGRENGPWQGQGRTLTIPLRDNADKLRAYIYIEKSVDLKDHDWEAIELINFHTNIRAKPWRLLRGYKGLICVLEKNLRYWQALSEKQGRPVPIFVGLDVHQNLKILGKQLDPYECVFRMASTHIFLAVGVELSETSVIQAIKKGRTYIAFDCLADPTGFQFIAKKGRERFLIGDAVAAPDELAVKIPLAQDSEIRIFKDNNLVLQRKNMKEFYIFDPKPGFWRVEIYRDGLPWIISGQILVK